MFASMKLCRGYILAIPAEADGPIQPVRAGTEGASLMVVGTHGGVGVGVSVVTGGTSVAWARVVREKYMREKKMVINLWLLIVWRLSIMSAIKSV